MVRQLLVSMFLVAGFTHLTMAADPILLWPDGAPGKVGDEDVDKPWLWAYPAAEENRTGTAVVICPGGGYGALAVDHEGHQIARWYNRFGVSAFVLKYRLGQRYRHPAPMNDVQRALQWVRANAATYHLATNRIGVMGFSAGGHLASTAATHFANGDPQATDPVARVSSRPDFAVLCYPVISLQAASTHKGSVRNLLGPEPDPELLKLLSNEMQVTENTPPTFLFHTADDAAVPVENSLAFYAALRKAKVPAEMHIYQSGPHGVGLALGHPSLGTWSDRLHDWLRDSGFLAEVKRGALKGKVSVDGVPLKWGQIRFTPTNSAFPVTMGMIRNGVFSLDSKVGPIEGENSVQVFDLGDVVPMPTLEDARRVTGEETVLVLVRSNGSELELDLSSRSKK